MSSDQHSTRKRLSPEHREQAILDGAVAFFAEVGFDGSTRDLATRLGITQPLLYRYFPSKEVLLDRVYQSVYLSNWNPQWERRLVDRRVSLERRLCAFYCDYARVILTYKWVRLFMFAGLKGLDFNERYLEFLRSAVFDRIIGELRLSGGLPTDVPPSRDEVELVWGLHASIFYLGVRRWIYGLPIPSDVDADVALRVGAFFRGAPAMVANLPRGNPNPLRQKIDRTII